jgi:hypothetical protein
MIKVFRFRVSNSQSLEMKKKEMSEMYRVQSEEEIENVLNQFLSDKKLISLQVNNVDVNYHNNGYANTIDLIYTIVYQNK